MNKIGKTYGELTVISFAERKFFCGHWRIVLNCQCTCGKKVTKLSQNLIEGQHSSCGCWTNERIRALGKIKGKDRFWNYRHGMFGTRFYGIYNNINQRCNNKNCVGYRFYGAIGIKNEFRDFNHFKAVMYPSYLDHVKKYGIKQTTIDRIESSKNYSPQNCRWASYKEQSNNRCDNLALEYKGKKLNLNQWAKYFNTSEYLAFKKITGLDYNKSRHLLK